MLKDARRSIPVGVHEISFRIDERGAAIGVGVVPATEAVTQVGAPWDSYVYYSGGGKLSLTATLAALQRLCMMAIGYYSPNRRAKLDDGYENGDVVAVLLDLDASTVAFCKHGANGKNVIPRLRAKRNRASV